MRIQRKEKLAKKFHGGSIFQLFFRKVFNRWRWRWKFSMQRGRDKESFPGSREYAGELDARAMGGNWKTEFVEVMDGVVWGAS